MSEQTLELRPDKQVRVFYLLRLEDVSGVSGTGIVAGGVLFPDGTAVLRWFTETPTSVVFHDNGMESVEAVHGHNGKTIIVWEKEDPSDGEIQA